ncbi:bile acid:sodium symporter family protein [Paraburkholderia sp. SOS3]|jgi:sodium/bile acid cotransporter 7|uniref:bile acid:sodium symporter family protein n=1 Tax=Paraburkholderia sp. SOS3 TaxID=1926494 RepID=UPI00094776CF|nr:bile acid:sodium symporter family protein [Paraburkholderia sp. SOS3]APR38538.1 bile acid:sodium symporter [Paraburkholderia sp. SOS3]
MSLHKLIPDKFTLALVCTVVFATLLPCRGSAATAFNWLTDAAIALLFFLHGAKLSREAIVAGASNWKLHAAVFCSTFVLFPLLGVVLHPVLGVFVKPWLYLGVLFLCTLPSTVQSSIAFTSMANGNVSAAVCSASASSLLGIFLTPALVSLIVSNHASGGGSAFSSVGDIVLQLFVPFIAGQLLRPVIGRWVDARKELLRFADQGSIVLIVYVAFSEAVNGGIWHQLSASSLVGIVIVNMILLASILLLTTYGSKWLGFSDEDRVTIIFCGSKKSMASGIAMAKILFGAHAGLIVLPVMLFHQIQLMACSVLAQRWGSRTKAEPLRHGPANHAKLQ